jgi:peptide/nickel transport system permease protein
VGLWGFVARRLLLSILVVFIVTIGSFALLHAVPGDPVDNILGDRVADDPVIRDAAIRRYGFDKPLYVQYVTYVGNLLQGDLGESITTRRPVMTDLRQFVPATIELTGSALIFAMLTGIPLGIVAAIRQDRWGDYLARFVALIGTSIPVFWLALLLLYVFFYKLQWLPGPGQLDAGMEYPDRVTGMVTIDALLAGQWQLWWVATQHLILPSIALGAFAMGIFARMLRSSLLASLNDDYVRTARAKGLSERKVVVSHALRNALIPTVTVIGLTTASLLAGAVLTETTFSRPGIGSYGVDAAMKRDFPGLFGVTVFVAVIYVLVNLIVDIVYGLLDPRIRIG